MRADGTRHLASDLSAPESKSDGAGLCGSVEVQVGRTENLLRMLALRCSSFDLRTIFTLLIILSSCAKPAGSAPTSTTPVAAPSGAPRFGSVQQKSGDTDGAPPREMSRVGPAPGMLRPGSCAYVSADACARRCEEKDYDSCGALALLYANGWGVSVDELRAVALAKMSCAKESATGCGLLGTFYGLGVGVERNAKRAKDLLMFSCTRDDALSCESLGGQSIEGLSGPMDLKLAADYFLKACELGHLRACFKAGAAIQDGNVVSSHRPNALYAQSCQAGFATACYLLGNNLESGFEGHHDLAAAKAAFTRACELGNEKACARR